LSNNIAHREKVINAETEENLDAISYGISLAIVTAVLKPLSLFPDCDRYYMSCEDYSETESSYEEFDELIAGGRFADRSNFELDQTK